MEHAQRPENLKTVLANALADRYQVDDVLGTGGMAIVYRAIDLKHSRPVAIKVMRPEISSALGAERFLNEISIAARLQHPHILALIDSGEIDGTLYYVMPYLEGQTLAESLAAESRLSVTEAVRITSDVLSALHYAHERNVLHRDIKPANIMLTGGHAVVMDFGIARAMDSASTRLTNTGMLVGTPAYMSPENLNGEADKRSDVYAVGCMLYEMLAGAAPFTGPTAQAIMLRHLTQTAPPLSSVRKDISHNLEDVVKRALEKNPDDRFQDATAFATEMHAAVSGEVLKQTPSRHTPAAPARSAAYDQYLRGIHCYNKRNEKSNDRAIELLEIATSADPEFAIAFAALAQAYIERFFRYDANEEWEERAFVAIEKARVIDPGLAATYIAKGNLLWTTERRFPHDDVIAEYRRALAIEPDNTEALNELGKVLFHIGRLDEAAALLNRTLELDSSLASARFRLSLTEMLRGNYARSLELQKQLPGISYGSSITALRALNHHYLGRTDEGRRMLAAASSEDREESDFNSIEAIFHALSGNTTAAEKSMATEIEISKGLGHYHHAVAYMAAAYAIMGKHDAAIDGISNAADDGFPSFPWFERDPCLASIQSHPRFVSLIAELKSRWSPG